MRKLTALVGALLVLVLAVAGGFSTPQAAYAICYCDPNDAWLETPNSIGTGSNCTEARNQLLANTANDAYAACGSAAQTCLGALRITWPCEYIGNNTYREMGYRLYKCKKCEPPE